MLFKLEEASTVHQDSFLSNIQSMETSCLINNIFNLGEMKSSRSHSCLERVRTRIVETPGSIQNLLERHGWFCHCTEYVEKL